MHDLSCLQKHINVETFCNTGAQLHLGLSVCMCSLLSGAVIDRNNMTSNVRMPVNDESATMWK